jgi:hemin uptake protein HemP
MSTTSKQAATAGGQADRAEPPRLHSRDLLAGAREVVIEHEGDLYRLRCTSKGKLILTK